MAYNKRRWGSDGWTRDLRRSAKHDGCEFGGDNSCTARIFSMHDFQTILDAKDCGWAWWPHTLHAHRLVLLAERHGGLHVALGERATEILFRQAYEDSC